MGTTDDYKNILYKLIDQMAENHKFFAKDPARDFTRSRKLDLGSLLRVMLCMGAESIDAELYKQFKDNDRRMTRSAFVQQRDKLKPDTLEFLFHQYNRLCHDERTGLGYHVYAVDGTDILMPLDKDAATYIENCGYNQMHLNALYDILNQTYADAILQPKPHFDERRALMEMLEHLPGDEDALIIADRGYDSYAMFETINRMPNAEFVIRIKNNGKKLIRDLPMETLDADVTFDIRTTQTKEDREAFDAGTAVWIAGKSSHGKDKKYTAWPFESRCLVDVRIVRFPISEKNGEPVYETIATSLPREFFSIADIKGLYSMRWDIETSFRDLKYQLNLANLHAKKEEAIIHEIYARLIAYNFCKRVSMHIKVKQKLDRKYKYKLNFAMAVVICMDFLRDRANKIRGPDVDEAIEQYVEPIRPGRTDKRKKTNKSFVPFQYRNAA